MSSSSAPASPGCTSCTTCAELGLRVTLLEAGAGLGGIWYWNCYPGARVDSHVPLYEYSDPALWQDWYWDERFPDWQALRRYFDHVDDVWGLRDDIRFETRVTAGAWDEAQRCWELRTDAGDTLRTRFVVLCTGFAAKAYVPDIPGLDTFAGDWSHTAHWPQGGVDLTGRRVAVIGTGASGVQVVQEAARVAEHVTVFQRTPIMALAMQQRRLTREDQDEAKAEYPAIFERRTQTNSGFAYPERGVSTFDVSGGRAPRDLRAPVAGGGVRVLGRRLLRPAARRGGQPHRVRLLARARSTSGCTTPPWPRSSRRPNRPTRSA